MIDGTQMVVYEELIDSDRHTPEAVQRWTLLTSHKAMLYEPTKTMILYNIHM